MWLENREAWEIYQSLCQRAVDSLELAGPMVLRELEHRSDAEAWDLIARLSIILDALSPRESAKPTDDDG